jgi:intergrase/recombinase
MLKRIALGSLFAVGLIACDASKDVEKYADRACECKDKDCAKKVMEDFVSWMNDHKDARGDEKKAEAALKRMTDCAQKAGLTMSDQMTILQKLGE